MECSKGWANRCYNAKSPASKCKCRCGGEHHHKGYEKAILRQAEDDETFEDRKREKEVEK